MPGKHNAVTDSEPRRNIGATTLEDVVIRPLETAADREACVALQRATWGDDFNHIVAPSILMIAQKVGGVAAGAFDAKGTMLGFVFGITGVKDGRLSHWSDMLAVRGDLRGGGLGRRLKLYQREALLPLGVESVYWTYDPLEARNAHLNLNRLGADITEYVVNMYGEDTASVLHAGLGTDRFVVDWRIASPKVLDYVQGNFPNGEALPEGPVLTLGLDSDTSLPSDAALLVEIPSRIQETKQSDPRAGREWRLFTRNVFTHYLASGYRVQGFQRRSDGRCLYVLTNTK